MEKLIFEYYEYFYSRLSKFFDYEFKPSEKDKKIVENFLKLLKKEKYNLNSLGENWFFEYFAFQFNYWVDKNTRYGKNKPLFSWIVGTEAYNRWKDKSKDYKYWYENNLLRFYQIKKSDIFSKKFILKNQSESIEYYEREKERFYNLDMGWLNCLIYTDLYNEKSRFCLNCNYGLDCKKIKEYQLNEKL